MERDIPELEEKNTPESDTKSETGDSKPIIKSTENISEIKKENTVPASIKETESDTLKLEASNNTYASVLKRNEKSPELEERAVINPTEIEEENRIYNKDIELEDQPRNRTLESANKLTEGTLEIEVKSKDDRLELEDNSVHGTLEFKDETAETALKVEEQSQGNHAEEDDFSDDTTSKDKETEVPLLIGESVSINMHGESSTVHVHTKDNAEEKSKKSDSPFLSPVRRIRNAWDKSSSVCDFVLRADLIIFSTLGWILCIGGVPFVSIVMFIIGSVFIDDCKVQPNIPVYLIVGGVIGTLQHFVAFWNKCLPEERQGRLSKYKTCYSAVDGAITLFLLVWFIVGCSWVYGVRFVEFVDTSKDEYCHQTLYYFSFWLLNVSFVLIAVVVVLSLCLLLFIIGAPKKEAVV